jgi:hypothetical protein
MPSRSRCSASWPLSKPIFTGIRCTTLTHEAKLSRAQRRQRTVVEAGRVGARHDDTTGRRPIEQADDVEQRALAGTGRPDQRRELAAMQFEVDAPQRTRAHALAVLPYDTLDGEQGISHHGSPQPDRAGLRAAPG